MNMSITVDDADIKKVSHSKRCMNNFDGIQRNT